MELTLEKILKAKEIMESASETDTPFYLKVNSLQILDLFKYDFVKETRRLRKVYGDGWFDIWEKQKTIRFPFLTCREMNHGVCLR